MDGWTCAPVPGLFADTRFFVDPHLPEAAVLRALLTSSGGEVQARLDFLATHAITRCVTMAA